MSIADKIEVGWYEQFIAEHRGQLRRSIVGMVRAYSTRTGTPHREVWHTVYERLEQTTGLSLQAGKGVVLDRVAEQGCMDDLYRIVHGFCE
jgi:hypothetical protein